MVRAGSDTREGELMSEELSEDYAALAASLTEQFGVHPALAKRIATHAARRNVLSGERKP